MTPRASSSTKVKPSSTRTDIISAQWMDEDHVTMVNLSHKPMEILKFHRDGMDILINAYTL